MAMQRYKNTDGHKLIYHHTRTEFEKKYNINIPMALKYMMIRFFQPMESFLNMCPKYNVTEHGAIIERNSIEFGHQIINHAQQIVNFRSSETKSIISIWKIQLVNNKYLENVFCGFMCGIMQYQKDDESKELDFSYHSKRHFIAINENGQQWSEMKGFISSRNENPSWNQHYFKKSSHNIKNGDIIKIMLSTQRVKFSINDNYKFSADIYDRYEYKMFVSFKYEGGKAKLISFKQIKLIQ